MTKEFDPELFISPENWDEKNYRWENLKQDVLGYAINVSKLMPDQKNKVRTLLEERGITVREDRVSIDTPHIRKGELAFRVSDSESVLKLELCWEKLKQSKNKEVLDAVKTMMGNPESKNRLIAFLNSEGYDLGKTTKPSKTAFMPNPKQSSGR